MIKLINLSYTYPIDHHVFKNLNIEITEGEFWGVLGRNGAGKTTLVDLILGVKYPSTGSALVLDKKVKRKVSASFYLSNAFNTMSTYCFM